MANSRLLIQGSGSTQEALPAPDTPTNTSRDFGKILENVYKPGFVDQDNLENTKMAVDRELGEISKAFFQTTERTTDTIKRIDNIEIGNEDLAARIEEVDTVSKAGDVALAERITTVEAEYKAEDDLIKASVVTESSTRASADSALASQITTVESELGDDIAAVQTYATTNINRIDGEVNLIEAKWGVRVNVNNKVTGIQLNNDGNQTSFAVQADQFIISDGTSNTGAPFEVLGGVTKIKNASVGTITSDNWNGSTVGWAITKDGNATFNNVNVRGNINAQSFTGFGATGQIYTDLVPIDMGPNTPFTTIRSIPFTNNTSQPLFLMLQLPNTSFSNSYSLNLRISGPGVFNTNIIRFHYPEALGLIDSTAAGWVYAEVPANFSGTLLVQASNTENNVGSVVRIRNPLVLTAVVKNL